MKKIIVFNMISLDGFFAGINGDISWHNVDREFNDFAIKQLQEEAGTLMFGRLTYELMAAYWPSEAGIKDSPLIADLMNSSPKIVFSKSMETAGWNNTRLIKKINQAEIEHLKKTADKDLLIFGSGQIVNELAKLDLIDEYRLMLNPVALGAGKPLFKDKLKLKLLKTKEFSNGNVLLCYSSH